MRVVGVEISLGSNDYEGSTFQTFISTVRCSIYLTTPRDPPRSLIAPQCYIHPRWFFPPTGALYVAEFFSALHWPSLTLPPGLSNGSKKETLLSISQNQVKKSVSTGPWCWNSGQPWAYSGHKLDTLGVHLKITQRPLKDSQVPQLTWKSVGFPIPQKVGNWNAMADPGKKLHVSDDIWG